MKNYAKHLGIIVFAAIIGFGFLSCDITTVGSTQEKMIVIRNIQNTYVGKFGALVLYQMNINTGITRKAYTREIKINGDSQLFSLLDSETGGVFTGSGYYAVEFLIYENQNAVNAKTPMWEGSTGLPPNQRIMTETTTIDFSEFTEQSVVYDITGSAPSSFSARKSGTAVGATGTIQTVINAIRTNANGEDVSIRFGNGTTELNIGTASVDFNNTGGTWKKVTISGKIRGSGSPVVTFGTGVTGSSRADITQTSSGGTALQKTGTGTLTITEGTITGGNGASLVFGFGVSVDGSSTTKVDIQGGTISGGYAVKVDGGTVTISGGSITSSSNGIAVAIVKPSDTVTISGGTITGTGSSGTAITTFGKITLSGSPIITSANTQANGGTISIRGRHSGSGNTLTIEKTVEDAVTLTNTAGGKRVYIDPSVSPAPTCGGSGWLPEFLLDDQSLQRKIRINGIDSQYYGKYGKLVLSLSATEKAYASETISGTTSNPYIDFSLLDSETGGEFTENGTYSVVFRIYENQQANDCIWEGTLSTKSISLETTTIEFSEFTEQSLAYIITGSGSSFSATKGGVAFSGSTGSIQDVIDAIKTNENGAAVTTIRFGNGTNELDIGTGSVDFNNTGGTWGNVTISGKITGQGSPLVTFSDGVSGSSSADINQTSGGGTALLKNNSGTLTITGGAITGTTTNILSLGTGVNVKGSSNATIVNIQGGAISGGYAVTVDGGTVTISGGSVSSSSTGRAITIMNSTDTVNISGGTITGTGSSGTAITTYGKIILSGTPTITSANTQPDGGTISILGGHTTGNTLTIANTVTLTNTAGGKRVYITPNLNPSATCGGTGWSDQFLVDVQSSQRKISISDIDSQYNGKYGALVLSQTSINKAYAFETINGTSHTFPLLDSSTGGIFTESGNYSVEFLIYENQAAVQAGTPIWGGRKDITITQETTPIPFSEFTDQFLYVITSSGSSFSATKGGVAFSGSTGSIQDVIDAIKTNENGAAVTTIRFGNGTNELNIGTGSVDFNNTGRTWGNVTISGKITGQGSPLVTFSDGVSGSSSADINQTSGGGTALLKSNSGTLTITGGAITGTTTNILSLGTGVSVKGSTATIVNIQGGTISGGYAVMIDGGTVTISGGSVSSSSNGRAITIVNSTDTVNISGGTITGTGSSGTAITTYGKIILSGNPTITSANTQAEGGTISILGGHTTGETLTIANTVTLKNTAGGKLVYITPNLDPSATCGGTGWSDLLLQ